MPGVIGHGVGLPEAGSNQMTIEVYVECDPGPVRRQLPQSLEGIAVRVVRTGRVVAY